MSKIALSIGTYRALARATDAGVFQVLAVDHQDSLRRAMRPDAPDTLTPDELTAFKLDVVSTLSGTYTAALLDPVYGAAQAVASGAIGQRGLLVELEQADYGLEPLPQRVDVLDGWSVAKIKRMGSDGVKLFFYYNADDAETRAHQDAVVTRAVHDCNTHDVPLYAEPIVYPGGLAPAARTDMVVRGAAAVAAMGAHVLKLEFPAAVGATDTQMRAACEAVTAACAGRPWVLLSAGVSFDMFEAQVAAACEAGAAGYMVGRAVWGDAATIPDRAARQAWLRSTGKHRMRTLSTTALSHATPWTTRYESLPVSPGWYNDYGEF